VLNKSEALAYEWLRRTLGERCEVIYQKRRVPTFITDKGKFEVKRGYKTKTGEFLVLFPPGQRRKLMDMGVQVLVFAGGDEPIAVIKPEELSLEKVGNIVLHDYAGGKTAVNLVLTDELLERIDRDRAIYGLSRSAFVEWKLREALRMVGEHY
jgi:hypothetical protein